MKHPSNEIIDRVLADLGTKDEAREVATWFATPEGQVRLSQMISENLEQTASNRTEEVSVNHKIPSEKMFAQIEQAIRRRRLRRRLMIAAAVVIPLLAVIGIGAKLHTQVDLFGTDPMQEIYVAKGERLQFLFQDGTRVYVNSDTHIYYPKRFGFSSRRIRLVGEAYFSVHKNSARPFIIESQGCEVRVLGTEFNLDAYLDRKEIIVSLDEGRVALTGKGNTYDLKPQEQLVYDKSTGLGYINHEISSEQTSCWKKNIIAFQDASFEEVVTDLERWFNIKVSVQDLRAYKYSFTLATGANQLDTVLQDLESVAPVKFNRTDSTVMVTVSD